MRFLRVLIFFFVLGNPDIEFKEYEQLDDKVLFSLGHLWLFLQNFKNLVKSTYKPALEYFFYIFTFPKFNC